MTKATGMMTAALLVTILASIPGTGVQAQDGPYYYLSGHITDKQSSKPVGGAQVEMDPGTGENPKMVVSFDDGYYNMSLPPGLYTVKITASGFKAYTGTVNHTGNVTIDFSLTRSSSSACNISGVVMVAPMAALGLAAVAGRTRRQG